MGVGVRDIPQGCPIDAPQHWPESASDSVEELLSHIQYIEQTIKHDFQ